MAWPKGVPRPPRKPQTTLSESEPDNCDSTIAFYLHSPGGNLAQVGMVTFAGRVVQSNNLITEPDSKAIALAMLQNYVRDLFLYEREPASAEVTHV